VACHHYVPSYDCMIVAHGAFHLPLLMLAAFALAPLAVIAYQWAKSSVVGAICLAILSTTVVCISVARSIVMERRQGRSQQRHGSRNGSK
jgi:hypothetical protein